MAKSPSKAVREKTKEINEELAHPNMVEFDRMMDHLVRVPKEKIDHVEKKKAERNR